MVYRKTYKRNNKRVTRRPRRKSKNPNNRMILRKVNYLSGLIDAEHKFFDYNIPSTGELLGNISYKIHSLSSIAQGDDINMRNGRSIKVKSSNLKARIILDGLCESSIVRIILFYDKSQKGSAVDMSDIYDVISGDDAINSFRNIITGTTQRYKILYNKTFALDKDYKNQIYISNFQKLNHTIRWTGTSGNDSALGQGAMYLAAISTGPQTENFTARLFLKHRLRYVDN